MAAFSLLLWSKDYVIIVRRRYEKIYIELNVLKYGDNWVTHKIKYEGELKNITGATYYDETFYFLDYFRHGITYCPKKNLLTTYFHGRNIKIIFSSYRHEVTTYLDNPPSEFEVRQGTQTEVGAFEVRQGIGTEVAALGHCTIFFDHMEGSLLISTCGTLMHYNHIPTVIHNEKVRSIQSKCNRQLKGVWIHPTFYDI